MKGEKSKVKTSRDGGRVTFTRRQSLRKFKTFLRRGTHLCKLGIGSSSPSVFTNIDTFGDSRGELRVFIFNNTTILSGRKLRFEFQIGSDPLLVRQLVAGQRLSLQMGQYAGISPPRLLSGIVQSNTIAQNGSILGRNVRRLERNNSIDLQYLTESWIRDNWDPFARHASRFAFIYQWNHNDYPDEVAFATGEVQPPVNSMPPGHMSVTMPMKILVADKYNVL